MKKIIASILAVAALMTAAMSASAIEKSDTIIYGGNTVFTQAEIMYEGEPTAASKWSNAFCNEDWTGCRWTAETVDGKDVVKVVSVAGKSANYMDFNWYQWNNDKYYPSLKGSDYKYLVVRYKLNDIAAETAAGAGTFWASENSPELGKTTGTGTISYTMTGKANEWATDVIALDSLKLKDVAWSDTGIRQFRYYPFGKAAAKEGAVCYIEWMAFFKTEAEAKAYNGPKKAEEAKPGAAAATADPIALVVVAAAASMGLAFVAGKRK